MLTRAAERLADWTTLRVGGPARRFLQAETREELYGIVADCDDRREPVLVLGGGSNLLVGDDGFPGSVVRVATRGIRGPLDGAARGGSAPSAQVMVEAGDCWDDLVTRAVEEGWCGVEALAGIPGTVGAVPIQNVGAYGQEVADRVFEVHVYDRLERRTRSLAPVDCGFSYRDSVFKRHPERYVVGAVTFEFPVSRLGDPIRYAELARRLNVEAGASAPAGDVRSAVLELRRAKGMVLEPADHDTWSAGSFFTNPVIPADLLPEGAPTFPQPDGRVKTSAAWLIERSGFGKGYGSGQVSLSTKHTLAITNRGGASAEDVLRLARHIRTGVEQTFGIRLQPEPVQICCAL